VRLTGQYVARFLPQVRPPAYSGHALCPQRCWTAGQRLLVKETHHG